MHSGKHINRRTLLIEDGAYVTYKGGIYRITQMINMSEVVGTHVETNRAERLPVADLEHVTEETVKDFAHTHKDLSEFSDKEWATAQLRMSAILPLLRGASRKEAEKIADQHGIHYTTLYRWRAAYLEGGGILGLIPRKEGRPEGTIKIDVRAERVIHEVIENFYLTKQRPTVQAVIRKVHAVCHERGITPPSNNTIRNRINRVAQLQQLQGRHGKKAARDALKPTPGHFEAEYPLEVVQIDHTKVDIVLVDDEHRQPIGRPWITLAVDIFSRMVHGYYLSLEAPSAASVAMCIANAAIPKEKLLIEKGVDADWPVWGFMHTIHVDNGADFRSEALSRAALTYNINLNYRPVGQSNFGGHIERLIGTVMKEVHHLPGTTFSNPQERQEYNAEANASMTLDEFEAWFLTFIAKVYHKREHTALGMSPEAKFFEGIFGTKEREGTGYPPKPSDPQSIVIDFLPGFYRTVQRNGINLDGLNYYDSALRSMIHTIDAATGKKKKFLVKRNPKDISRIWLYDDTTREYYDIPLANQAIPQMTLWEYEAVKKSLQESGQRGVDDRAIIAAYEEMHAQADKARLTSKKVRRQSERKKTAVKETNSIAKAAQNAIAEMMPHSEEDDSFWDDDIPAFDVE